MFDSFQVLELAKWVWCSFRPGEEITAQQKVAEATKIMRRCDKDESGSIGREEFAEYYEKTTADSFRCDLWGMPWTLVMSLVLQVPQTAGRARESDELESE